MNIRYAIALIVTAATLTGWAADPLTELLQKGLFEEEANHDLNAAIQSYQSVVSQADQQRKLAATAVFRLGECYRKLGRTNESTIQYQRVVRDFADQTNLVTLSQQNLGGLTPTSTVAASANNARTVVMSNLRSTLGETEAILQKLRDLQKRGQPSQLADSSELRSRIVAAFGVEETDRWVKAWQNAGSEYSSAEGNLSSAEEDKKSEAESRKSSAESGLKKTFDALIAGVEEQQGKLKVKLQFLTVQADGSSAENATLKAADDDPVRFEQALEIERLKAMLRNSPDLINAVNPQVGQTPLCSGASKGQVDVVSFLLDNRADVNQGQAAGNKTALHEAVENGHKAVVDLLLARGADINAATTQGVTPLHLAVVKGFYQVCESLLAHQAKLDVVFTTSYDRSYTWFGVSGKWTPLLLAIREHRPSIAELLLQKGASVDLPGSERVSGERMITPLTLAIMQGDRSLVELLLKHHATVDQIASSNTALMVACGTGHFDLIDPLLAAGASVNPSVAAYSETPLSLAIKQSYNTNAIKKLLAAGANPNALVPGGSPLLMSVMDFQHSNLRKNFQEILNLLLSAKPDLEQTNAEGATVLLRSCSQDIPSSCIAALLDAGANPNAVFRINRETPLFIAVRYFRKDLANLLLNHGAQVNWINEEGLTPIVLAKQSAASPSRWNIRAVSPDQEPVPVRASPQEIVELLIKAGADETYHLKDSISISRSTWPSPLPILRRTDRYPNRFTLLEFLAMAYSQNPFSLSFPSFESISIRHPGTTDKPGQTQTVNVGQLILSGDRSKDDVFLDWGDIVEVPEAVHFMDGQWIGFPQDFGDKWGQCLQRTVTIDINGVSQKRALQMPNLGGLQAGLPAGLPAGAYGRSANRSGAKLQAGLPAGLPAGANYPNPFWLASVVQRSGLVRSTSDLSRIRVIRRDPASGQETVFSADLAPSAGTRPTPNDDLWLQDGDRIEIPDRAEPDAKPAGPPGGA